MTDSPAPLLPLTRGEGVTVMAHLYRGEIARMAGWRDRIDQTSNWAITATAAMLSLSLSTPSSHHSVLIFAMLLILLLLLIEGRRYRFFDVYRARVRMLERYYLATVLDGQSAPEADWARLLADDLRVPRFRISLREAMSRRLKRNYGWMYLILLLAWILKITTPLLQPVDVEVNPNTPVENILATASAGALPGWIVLAAVTAFYASIGWLLLQDDGLTGVDVGKVHV